LKNCTVPISCPEVQDVSSGSPEPRSPIWLKVEAGFRAGRELRLDRPVLTIGRAESCDLGLFGDMQIEKLHARIYQQDGRYLIADNHSTHGTFVNDQRVTDPTLLRSGDLIRVGSAYLRFRARKP
jgi:pSer/pThr/pTyr-binding forkhead associated (FHA) protein